MNDAIDDSRRAGRVVRTYRVIARARAGDDLELAGGILRRDVAVFLEQQLERELGIVDAAVTGEVSRGD